MYTRLTAFGLWFATLLIVYFLIDFLTFTLAWAGSGAGTGVFSYSFRARIQFDANNDDGRPIFGEVRVEGRTEPHFRMWGHVSPRYREVQITWYVFQDAGSEGLAVLDLEHMQIQHGGRTVPLNTESISRLFGIQKVVDGEDWRITELIAFLRSAREGTLPVPRHHGIALPGPLSGNMHHFASGSAIRPLALIWIIVWSILGLSQIFRAQYTKAERLKQSGSV